MASQRRCGIIGVVKARKGTLMALISGWSTVLTLGAAFGQTEAVLGLLGLILVRILIRDKC